MNTSTRIVLSRSRLKLERLTRKRGSITLRTTGTCSRTRSSTRMTIREKIISTRVRLKPKLTSLIKTTKNSRKA